MFRTSIIALFCLIQVNLICQEEENYLIREYKEHKGVVNCVAFSPGGKYLASGGEDKSLIIYNLLSGEIEYKYTENYFPIKDVEFYGEDKLFVTAGSDIKLIDLLNNKIALYEGNATHIWSIDFAPERNKLTAGSYDNKIKVWDVKTQKMELVLEGHKKSTLPVSFSPDEKYIVSGSLDQSIKIWNALTGEMMHSLEKHTANIFDVTFHPNAGYFASASGDMSIRLWNMSTQEVIKTYVGHSGSVVDIEFSPDGYFLYSASTDGTVIIWEVTTGKKIYSYILHEGAVNAVTTSADGFYVATAGSDGKVLLWKSAKIIEVETEYGSGFNADMSQANIFAPKQKGESKEQYEERRKQDQQKYHELINKYFARYEEKNNYKNIP